MPCVRMGWEDRRSCFRGSPLFVVVVVVVIIMKIIIRIARITLLERRKTVVVVGTAKAAIGVSRC